MSRSSASVGMQTLTGCDIMLIYTHSPDTCTVPGEVLRSAECSLLQNPKSINERRDNGSAPAQLVHLFVEHAPKALARYDLPVVQLHLVVQPLPHLRAHAGKSSGQVPSMPNTQIGKLFFLETQARPLAAQWLHKRNYVKPAVSQKADAPKTDPVPLHAAEAENTSTLLKPRDLQDCQHRM